MIGAFIFPKRISFWDTPRLMVNSRTLTAIFPEARNLMSVEDRSEKAKAFTRFPAPRDTAFAKVEGGGSGRLLLSAAIAAGLLCADPAGAQSLVDEVRVGGFYHDAGIFGTRKERGADLNLELRFASPEFLGAIWSPRPHLGVTGSLAGDTSQLYFGLTWSFMLWRTGGNNGLFLDASLGGSAHNGKLEPTRTDRKALGSRVLFRESLEFGYRFGDVHSISVMLDHASNANLADHNEGIDSLGLRYGLKF